MSDIDQGFVEKILAGDRRAIAQAMATGNRRPIDL